MERRRAKVETLKKARNCVRSELSHRNTRASIVSKTRTRPLHRRFGEKSCAISLSSWTKCKIWTHHHPPETSDDDDFLSAQKKNEIGIRTFFGPLAFAWTENATLLDAVVVFATETFAPTNVDEVKAADMFVIIKLFFVRVCLWRIRESSKRRLAPQNSLHKKKRDFLQKGEIDWSKKLQKNKEKKTRDFHSPRQTRFWLKKKTTVCSRTRRSSFLV